MLHCLPHSSPFLQLFYAFKVPGPAICMDRTSPHHPIPGRFCCRRLASTAACLPSSLIPSYHPRCRTTLLTLGMPTRQGIFHFPFFALSFHSSHSHGVVSRQTMSSTSPNPSQPCMCTVLGCSANKCHASLHVTEIRNGRFIRPKLRISSFNILRPIYYIIFITQKLGATARNGFNILILHPKIHNRK